MMGEAVSAVSRLKGCRLKAALVIWFVWFVSFVLLNETNQMN